MDIESLFNQTFDRVYMFYYHKTLDQHMAEDLTSRAFLIFAQKARNTPIDNAPKYLNGIVRTLWLEYLRDKYRSRQVYVDLDSFTLPEQQPMGSSFLETDIAQHVARMPLSQKTIIELRYVNNLSPHQIAEHLGKDLNYVKTTHARAIRTLRGYLEEAAK